MRQQGSKWLLLNRPDQVVFATTKSNRNILVNTGGHGSKSGQSPTTAGLGEFQFVQQDIDTIRRAAGPGRRRQISVLGFHSYFHRNA